LIETAKAKPVADGKTIDEAVLTADQENLEEISKTAVEPIEESDSKAVETDPAPIRNVTKKVEIPKMVNIFGVNYDRMAGARCPMCRMPKAQITHTLSWENDIRVRYHCCRRCGSRFKSIEDN
jgi:Zn ribbon nucleic-acid-binding protein